MRVILLVAISDEKRNDDLSWLSEAEKNTSNQD